MICSSKTACIPFKEVFRLELLKSCSQVLPRDHSRAQNIVFFCMQQPTNHRDPYSLQPNKLQGRQPLVSCQQELGDKNSHCEQCVTLLPLSADWSSKALSTCQGKHTQGVRTMWACVTGKDRGFSNSMFCENPTFILKGPCVPGTGPCCEGGFCEQRNTRCAP